MNKQPENFIAAPQAGFTLIEVLVAIAIFSIGFMAVGALQTRSLKTVGTSKDKTLAMEALDAQVERLKLTRLQMDDVWHNDGIDHDGNTDPIFNLSPEFRPTTAPVPVSPANNPDYQFATGNQFTISWWIYNQKTIPNRWESRRVACRGFRGYRGHGLPNGS